MSFLPRCCRSILRGSTSTSSRRTRDRGPQLGLVVDERKGRGRGRWRTEDRLQLRRSGTERRRRFRVRIVCLESEHSLKRFSRCVGKLLLRLGKIVRCSGRKRIGLEDARGRLELRRVQTLNRVSSFRVFVSFTSRRSAHPVNLVGDRGRDRALVARVRRPRTQRRSGRNPRSVLAFLRWSGPGSVTRTSSNSLHQIAPT